MAYTPQQGQWIPMPSGDYGPANAGYWAPGAGFDYSGRPDPNAIPFFNQQGQQGGWTTQQNAGAGGSGLFGSFGGPGGYNTWEYGPDGNLIQGGGVQTPDRNGMTNFMSYAVPIGMMAAGGYGAANGAFAGAGGAATGGAGSGGLATTGPMMGAEAVGGMGGGASGLLGTAEGAAALGAGAYGAPQVSYGPGQNPTGMGEYAGYGGSSGGGGSATNPWISGAKTVAGGLGNALGGGSGWGSAIGGLLGAGLGYADAKSQPDSLTIKNEIDPRLANYAYGANGTGGIAGAANNLMQQQLGGPNPLADAGKQISGMANTMPNWNSLVDQSKSQWDANPWIQQQQGAITDKVTQNLLQNVMPGIGTGANMANGYGGSRHGIAQGLAISNMNTDLGSSLAQLASQGWENSQNRALSGAQSAGSYGLQNQLQQAGLLGTGANMQQQGLWAPIQNATNVMGALPGNTSQTQPLFNNPIAGAVGGGSLGSQVGGSIDWGKLFEGLFK